MMQRLPRDAAQALFFLSAAAYAAIVAPLSVYGLVTGRPLLAVVAGFLINRTTPQRLCGLLALWLAARASFLVAPAGLVASVFNTGFACICSCSWYRRS